MTIQLLRQYEPRSVGIRIVLTIFALIVWGPGQAWAQVVKPVPNQLCFRNAAGVPGPFYGRGPQIDGCLRECAYPSDSPTQHDDFAWTDAFQYVANPYNALSTPTGDVTSYGTRNPHSGALVMAFEVKNDNRFDDADAVVLALKGSAPGAPAGNDYVQIVIQPFFNHAGLAEVHGAIPQNTGQISYFPGVKNTVTNQVDWNLNPVINPSWVTAAVTSAVGATRSWTVEVELNLGEGGIDLIGSGFDFFYDVIRVYNPTALLAVDFPWPPAASTGQNVDVVTPTLDLWGRGTLNTGVCGGVGFAPGDIKTNQASPDVINPSGNNVFSVTLHNTLLDMRLGANQNKPMAAPGVKATFRIANFGLPSDKAWLTVDQTNPGTITAGTTVPANSTVPPASVNPGTSTLSSAGWTPPPAWSQPPATNHQCILAELQSTSSDVIFLNRAAFRNMNYGTNPGINPLAYIDGRWGPPPNGATKHVFELLFLPKFQFAYGDGTVPTVPVGSLTAQFVAQFIGYRQTGRHVRLGKDRYTLAAPVGSYGFFVQHEILDTKFASEFRDRHTVAMTAMARAPNASAAAQYALVNQQLADDSEKPPGWKFDFPGLTVSTDDGSLYRIEVDPDKVTAVQGAIKYNDPVVLPPCGNGCCGCARSATTASLAPIMGLAIGGLAFGRRRRRNRS